MMRVAEIREIQGKNTFVVKAAGLSPDAGVEPSRMTVLEVIQAQPYMPFRICAVQDPDV